MKTPYRLFRKRTGIFFLEEAATGRQESLRTRDKATARRLLHARNEACQNPSINLEIARSYLMVGDPLVAQRTWGHVMEAIIALKQGPTQVRWRTASKDRALKPLLPLRLLGTQAESLLSALNSGTVSTNVHLRKMHNFALDMNWLPSPVIPRRQWPKIRFGKRRAITCEEHLGVLCRETNVERRGFYELAWHTGAAQSDLAALTAENIDRENRVIRFFRRKTGSACVLRYGEEVDGVLMTLPSSGPLFPNFQVLGANHRATEFRRACRRADVTGVTLHSYRYAWAQRAKSAGYPERYAQIALGHNSRAVHEAYAGGAMPILPALDDYERAMKAKIVELQPRAAVGQ